MSTAPLQDRIAALESELKALKTEAEAERHPYAFRDLMEARMALRSHVSSDCGAIDRCRQILTTLIDVSMSDDISATSVGFLASELQDAIETIQEWQKRAHRLGIIVGDFDLDALSHYPGTQADAPPKAEARP